MYVPNEFSVKEQAQVDAFIASHPFITLITTSSDGFPIATHIPVVAKKANDNWILEGHLALANKQAQGIIENQKALCTLLGSDAYVSSSIYSYESVPTWNYQAVHIYGEIQVLNEAELNQHLNELVDKFEEKREKPLNFDLFSSKMMNSYKKEIIGIRIKASRIEAAFKLSQNHNEVDKKAIIADLEQCPYSGAKSIAEKMKENFEA